MASILDYMFDTSFLEEAIVFLRERFAVLAIAVDSEGNELDLGIVTLPPVSSRPVTRLYPFTHQDSLGGLKCMAADDTVLAAAEPSINLCLSGLGSLLRREIELQQTGEEMLQLSEQLNFLFKLTQRVRGVNRLKDFCTIVLKEISKAVVADSAFLHSKTAWNDDDLCIGFNLSEERRGAIEADANFLGTCKDKTILFSLGDDTSCLVTPINSKGGAIGFMVFLKEPGKRFFTSYEKKFVSIIEHIISPTIEALRLYDSLQELYLNTVKALAAAIDAKDEYTHGHSFRVAKYSVAIGRRLSIPDKKLTDLEIAAYMHDLGKIGISEAILGKPGKLTNEEFTIIKSHPSLTNKILEPIKLPEFIVNAAVQHHERLDGTGYPMGLRGDQISLYARIIMVADVFDALTSARPYRDAMSVEKSIRIICDGVDKEFDRNCVLAMVDALNDMDSIYAITKIAPDLKFIDIINFNSFLDDAFKCLQPGIDDRNISSQRVKKAIAEELKRMQGDNLFELCQHKEEQ